MLSAGLLGGPAIGFKQDYNASAKLKSTSSDTYERYKAEKPSNFFGFSTVGLDGAKVGVLGDEGKELERAGKLMDDAHKKDENHEKLAKWWESAKGKAKDDKKLVDDAGIHGGRMALKYTAYVPAALAVLYLLLILYFRARGGYKVVHLDGAAAH